MLILFYCGWDGGGTKTEVCVTNEEGKVLNKHSFGLLNLNGASKATIEQTVCDCVTYMKCQEGGLEACRGLVIGMAGASNRNLVDTVGTSLKECGYQGNVKIVGDPEIALNGAITGYGAVLIAGTGAVCYGRDPDGNTFRVGGYGYLIDDGGSGYAVGRDILSAIVRSYDGRNKQTMLTELVYSRLGIQDVGSLITWLYGAENVKKQVAALAPVLPRATEAGDEIAISIAENAADNLAELVLTAWDKKQMQSGELALMGSMCKHYPVIRGRLTARIRAALPEVNIIEPRGTPSEGAAWMAADCFG